MGSPMPKDLSEEAVAEWVWGISTTTYTDAPNSSVPWAQAGTCGRGQATATARAVLALVREKVREAVDMTRSSPFSSDDAIVSRVLGDHPQGGHDEGRPAREEA